MAEFILQPHPDSPETAIRSITASATREAGARLDLEFRIEGAIEAVAWPEAKRVAIGERLWEHSCVEAFVGEAFAGDGGLGYREFNFATSGEWAAYRFDEYRAGMRSGGGVLLAGGRTTAAGRLYLRRTVRLSGVNEEAAWRLGLAAIIEGRDGAKSYWALAHPRGKPDFHDPDCFIGSLAAPDDG